MGSETSTPWILKPASRSGTSIRPEPDIGSSTVPAARGSLATYQATSSSDARGLSASWKSADSGPQWEVDGRGVVPRRGSGIAQARSKLSGDKKSVARFADPRAAGAKTRSTLLPRQSMKAPAGDLAALMLLVERTFESFEHIDDVAESRFFKRDARVHRALTAAADQYDGTIVAGDFLHLADKV